MQADAVTMASYTGVPGILPPPGIFGDAQFFVLQSLDSDTETRDFSPVFLESGGVSAPLSSLGTLCSVPVIITNSDASLDSDTKMRDFRLCFNHSLR
jgi:hypothetical protein